MEAPFVLFYSHTYKAKTDYKQKKNSLGKETVTEAGDFSFLILCKVS